MNIIVSPYPSALKRINQKNKIVVIIDILRACTTIVHAFSQGCKAFYPVSSIKKAREKLKQLKGRGGVTLPLLGGERNGLKIKGFDLGNSPLEYTSDVVRNKSIIFTTSNCTKNLYACRQPKETLICSFLNIHRVVNYLSALNDDLVIALSGSEGDFSLEDAVCAGMLIDDVGARCNVPLLSDLGHICRIAYLHYKGNIIDALASSIHAKKLKSLGFEEDIKFCARIGNYEILPRYINREISCIQ
ncbi:MAG TPA: 2-phosphosulfolactate phosphatase [Candidatus Brocadiia bacterium]|nr:2-phosphosulfolactate phosphatase [Candidatus Brocadiales bacterium]